MRTQSPAARADGDARASPRSSPSPGRCELRARRRPRCLSRSLTDPTREGPEGDVEVPAWFRMKSLSLTRRRRCPLIDYVPMAAHGCRNLAPPPALACGDMHTDRSRCAPLAGILDLMLGMNPRAARITWTIIVVLAL